MTTPERSSAIVEAFSRLAASRRSDALVVSKTHAATFGDIDQLSCSVAEVIAGAGVPRGSAIGLSAMNGPGFLAGLLALRRTGHAAVLLDPLAPMVDRQRAAAAVNAGAILSCVASWPISSADLRVELLESPSAPVAEGIGVIKLTSGSTGVPRGVAMRESHVLADEDALARTMGFRDDDRLLSTLPLSHSYGFTTLALSAIVRGLTLVMPTEQGPFSPLVAGSALGATIFPTVPAYLAALLKVSQPPAWPSSIRLVISAGALLSPETASLFAERFGQRVHVFYGSSECGGICYDRDGGAAERGTVGKPVEGVKVTITEIDGAAAAEGLVAVESSAVGHAYYPATDTRLQDGRFETADLAAWLDGELVLKRRIDRVINLRGRKVDPSEVERVIASLEGVDEVVVLGVPSSDGAGQVVRAVVASTAADVNYGRVSAWCRGKLADHKVPRSIMFVKEIPRTSRGKIDRAALLAIGSAEDAEAPRG